MDAVKHVGRRLSIVIVILSAALITLGGVRDAAWPFSGWNVYADPNPVGEQTFMLALRIEHADGRTEIVTEKRLAGAYRGVSRKLIRCAFGAAGRAAMPKSRRAIQLLTDPEAGSRISAWRLEWNVDPTQTPPLTVNEPDRIIRLGEYRVPPEGGTR